MSFKTAKGTELPILMLKGKEYLEVKYRLVWFREEHPDWSIETEFTAVTDRSATARATIKDGTGRIVATSHKFENQQGFPDFLEKAETGSIGRALALCGYGTQFCADDLDEGKRIVDSPVTPATTKPAASGPVLRTATEPQIKRLYAIAGEHRISDDTLKAHIIANFTNSQTGEPLKSTKELTMIQYDRLVLDIKNGQLVKAVL